MTNLITNTYADFRSSFDNNPKSVLDFFTKNTIIFNTIRSFDKADDLHKYIEMISFYVDALYQKGRLNNTIETINKSILIIDSEIERLNVPEIKDDWYYSILFYKGMASHSLRDYKTAIQIFKKLIAHDPKNERYKNWLQHAVFRQRSKTLIVIYVVCGLLLFFQIVSKGYSWYSYTFRQTVSTIGLLTALSTGAYEYYLKRNLRKTKLS